MIENKPMFAWYANAQSSTNENKNYTIIINERCNFSCEILMLKNFSKDATNNK